MKQGVFHRGCFIGVFHRVFHRGDSEVVAAKRISEILESHIVVRFLVLEDKSPKGPAQADSSSEISAEDGLDVPVGISACSFPTTTLGKPRFRGGVS